MMVMSARMQLAKRLAASLDAARMSIDEAGMASVREEVKANNLVWQVNHLTAKLLAGHVREDARQLRLATKNKDTAEIERITGRSEDIFQLNKLAATTMMSSSKENPGDIVY